MINLESPSYRNSFYIALGLHALLAIFLMSDSSSTHPVLKSEAKTVPNQLSLARSQPEQAIKAVSVDNQEVMKAVDQLKQERLKQRQAEQNRQKALAQQAEAARKQRLAEQQRIQKLKAEAAQLAKEREQHLAEEQLRLKKLAEQKKLEEQRIADMKKQQAALQKQHELEAKKLAEVQKNKALELARQQQAQAEKAKAEQIKAEQAKAELAKKQAQAEQAAQQAERNALLAGEVDKYKALIINAISRQWILPENVNRGLSSQFRIRLAPNGSVLEVSLMRSSGDPVLDRSAQSAIFKASPLPVPSDPTTFNLFRDISLTVRPENVRG